MTANYVTQSLQEDLKKLDSIHREGIRIYTVAFRTSPAEAVHVEANDPSLEASYIHTLNTLYDSENQKYEESER